MSIDPDLYRGNVVDTTRRIRATGPGTPSDDVVDAFLDGLVHVRRRVEIYESDGETLWNPETEDNEEFSRIIDGSVTIDYAADERRVLDLTLDNTDLLLSPDPFNGLWYDKIIKPFYGVSFIGGAVPPKVAIIDSTSEATAKDLRRVLSTIGYNEIDVLLTATTADELRDYSVVFIYRTTAVSSKLALATELWNQGTHVFTFGTGTDETNMPHYFSTVDSGGSVQWGLSPTEGDSPVAGSFTSTTAGNGVGRIPTGTEIGVLPLAVYDVGTTTDAVTASVATSPTQGQWVDMHIIGFNATQTKNLLRAISYWIRGVGIPIEWETQIGEFMIDGLNYAHFPDQLKITGRDYVKKMKGSKLARATTFASGTKLRDLIVALAVNSGIRADRMRIGIGDEALTSDMTYDVGTERWQIAKEACTSFNYEIFFDAFGWLTVRKFIDPYLGPTSWVFKTGADGNLVSFDKTLNDSEIYNHIIVTAMPGEGELVMPYFGEAKNEDPSSPTRIERLGHRVLPVEANYLNSNAECQALAEALLKIHALEQYALNTQSMVFPWLEVGEIDEILDPNATETEPTRYLIDNLNIPMTLGPMGGTGKRITIVGQTGNPVDSGEGVSEGDGSQGAFTELWSEDFSGGTNGEAITLSNTSMEYVEGDATFTTDSKSAELAARLRAAAAVGSFDLAEIDKTLPLDNGSIVSAWVKIDETVGFNWIFKFVVTLAGQDLQIAVHGEEVIMGSTSNRMWTSWLGDICAFSEDVWYKLIVTFSGSTVTLAVYDENGVLLGSRSSGITGTFPDSRAIWPECWAADGDSVTAIVDDITHLQQ